MKDPETDRSKGYGFIIYNEAEDAKKAMEHLNGFELAGRPMKVGHVTEAGVPVGQFQSKLLFISLFIDIKNIITIIYKYAICILNYKYISFLFNMQRKLA